MKSSIQKKIVLSLLFIFPLVVYLFFASGVNNFAKLPVLTAGVQSLAGFTSIENKNIQLEDHITILCYWGNDLSLKQAEAFNLNEKIYKRFAEFEDFQFVVLVEQGIEDQVAALKNALQEGTGIDLSKWNFLTSQPSTIQNHFASLKTPLTLDTKGASPYVFIIDKEGKLRGRNDDEDQGTLYGFDARSVAEINKKMIDDVKVILAEYRLALKIYNTDRKK